MNQSNAETTMKTGMETEEWQYGQSNGQPNPIGREPYQSVPRPPHYSQSYQKDQTSMHYQNGCQHHQGQQYGAPPPTQEYAQYPQQQHTPHASAYGGIPLPIPPQQGYVPQYQGMPQHNQPQYAVPPQQPPYYAPMYPQGYVPNQGYAPMGQPMHNHPDYNLYNQMTHGLSSFFNFKDERFLKGAIVGAAATFLLTNDSVQKSAIKSLVKVWSLFQGGVEEVKERFRDAEAEIKSEEQQK